MTLETLARALRLDLALTVGQACRLTGHDVPTILNHAATAGWPLAERRLGLTRHSTPHHVTFLCRDARVAAYDGDLLRQLAGTAALRHHCGAGWGTWTVRAHDGAVQLSPDRWLSLPTPDAVWTCWADGEVDHWWVEYDAGSHTTAVLAERLLSYAQPQRRGDVPRPQLWGTGSEARTRRILTLARRVLPDTAVVVVRTVDWCPPRPHDGGVGERLRIPDLGAAQ
ncbi:hypothetical protein E7T09_01025 [Deinococcus sp. KSM4-11]|uniref:hypothetical protein n=1 Tax=Deinococcus sp. KSM4-11 TaxID=2568654 RepID=UPI0010A31E96|nr:hypothetical protein [Deinococcus sp. KSM4-11]THF87851.1 hypothetical protein E7T09_01025 [Deinococcus sp. KSM4-11]